MKLANLVLPLLVSGLLSSALTAQENDAANPTQYVEVRTYTLVNAAAEEQLDKYLSEALLPALKRQGLGPIGAFDEATNSDNPQVMLVIPAESVSDLVNASQKLAEDQEYQEAAGDYLSTPAKEPVVQRIRSELLRPFECWPQVTISDQKTAGQPRLFELRTYESPTEGLGDLKVEMFNAGEVPIFLDSDIIPVFMGQTLIGERAPSLTYMTVFADPEARDAGWKKFIAHPDWKVLSGVKKYAGTVSKIHKSDWVPKSYSDL